MFIPRLYYPEKLNLHQTLNLNTDASHYVTKVLRLRNDEAVKLFNGQGGEYFGLVKLKNKSVQVVLNEYHDINNESPLYISLGQGISRSERMDFSIQKTTECGVSQITPLETKRSLIKLDAPKKEKRQQHWQRVAISASEQSGRTVVPDIQTPQSLQEWGKSAFEGCSILFDTESKTQIKTIQPSERYRIAIGPESGFEKSEMEFLKDHGFLAISLGPRILRTETAGIVAVTLLQGLGGDL